jgi:outer membrane receptor protein involved in Fe transport
MIMAYAFNKRFWLSAAAASAVLCTPSFAQSPPQPTASASGEEIIVTATRREARLQDVPVAVTAITSQLIENSGVRDLQDLTSLTPSLQFNVSENEASATARLRGVGTQGSNPGLESAVGIFVDGVYRARNGVALTDLGEITQIEVLRGPQGTLFGRNTSAGLITVNSAGPKTDGVEAGAEATIGEYSERRIAGHLTGPIIEDRLAGRLFAARSQRDGFMSTLTPSGSRRDNDRDLWTVRGQILALPSDAVTVRVIGDYTQREETCCAAQFYNPELLGGSPFVTTPTFAPGATRDVGPRTAIPFPGGVRQQVLAGLGAYGPGGVSAIPGPISARRAFANRGFDQDVTDWGVSAQLDWDFANATLTSVTAYRDWSFDQGQDSDFTQLDIVWRPGDGSNGYGFKVFTQEFRLTGRNGPLDWLIGAFYADETLPANQILFTGADFGRTAAALNPAFALAAGNPTLGIRSLSNAGQIDTYKQQGRSLALFTHNIVSLDDKTDLTFGVRYTDDEKTLRAGFRTLASAAPAHRATLAASNPALVAFADCTPNLPAAASPLAAGIPLIVGLRSLYCAPFLRPELDARGYDQTRSEGEWSGVASLRRSLSDDVSAYFSYSRGYKSGGFNLDRDFRWVGTTAAPDTSFSPEMVDAFEVGLKTAFGNGGVILNLAAFANEYQDFQLNTFNGLQFVVTSVPEVTAQGIEADALWSTPITGLTMQGGLAYTETEYGDDNGWVFANRNPINHEATLANLPNGRLTNAPLWTVTNAITYRRPIFTERANGLAHLDFRYVSEQNTGSDLRASKVQPAYWLVNARIGLLNGNERIGLELWARNLLDEDYLQIAFDPFLQTGSAPLTGGAQAAFLGDPRTFGLTLRANY